MATARTCVYHVNNEDAGKSHAIAGEYLATITILYECFVRQVTTIGDANKMAYQGKANNSTFRIACRLFILA